MTYATSLLVVQKWGSLKLVFQKWGGFKTNCKCFSDSKMIYCLKDMRVPDIEYMHLKIGSVPWP